MPPEHLRRRGADRDYGGMRSRLSKPICVLGPPTARNYQDNDQRDDAEEEAEDSVQQGAPALDSRDDGADDRSDDQLHTGDTNR